MKKLQQKLIKAGLQPYQALNVIDLLHTGCAIIAVITLTVLAFKAIDTIYDAQMHKAYLENSNKHKIEYSLSNQPYSGQSDPIANIPIS